LNLNLNPAAKTEVAAMRQALIDQAVQNAKAIQTKDSTLRAKDVKI
jgi:transposase